MLLALRALGPWLFLLASIVVVCASAALVVQDPLLNMGFVAVACGFAAVSAAVSFVSIRDRQIENGLKTFAAKFVDKDASPSFITDSDGAIIYRNDAAQRSASQTTADTLASEFKSLFANPASVLYRLQEKARHQGAAREDIVTRKGQVRLAVHVIDDTAFLWRVEQMTDRNAVSNSLAIPMLSASSSGTILYMNDAFRRICGGRVGSLDRIFRNPNVSNGDVLTVDGGDGPVDALIAVVDGAAGKRDIYAFPAPQVAEEPSFAEGWDFFEKVPVPLLKICQNGAIMHSNTLAHRLLGMKIPNGMPVADMFEGLGRSISEWLSEIASGRTGATAEFLHVKHENKDVHVQMSVSRVMVGSEPVLIAVLSDATELKSLEAKFVQSQKMEAIGQLAGGVAHDFNNLLTAISGHCDLLLLRHDKDDPDFGDLSQIHQNANRAASLVGQLLAFSRKQTLKPQILDVQDTLADLTHLLNRLVGEKIKLETKHGAGGSAIRVDKRQLEQVMMNLIVNARDAMKDGGVITVDTRETMLTAPLRKDRATVPVGEYVVVSVTDQGTGIAPDTLTKIFEPFYTTKRQGEGTGLGLSTAYGIVKQTGGFIFVDSEVGVGTKFELYFPAHEGQEELRHIEEETPKLSQVAPHEGVVLLVEDEAPVRAFASRALRLRGYTVIEADCAEQALERLEDRDLQVDLFVTDVVMPGMDGPSWVKIALENRPDVKVVFVSGYAEDSFEDGKPTIPDSVFLPKPFSLNDLTETVQSQLIH